MEKNRIRRFNVERVANDDPVCNLITVPTQSDVRRNSNVFTNLALGNRIDATTNSSCSPSYGSMPVSQVIPIPQPQQATASAMGGGGGGGRRDSLLSIGCVVGSGSGSFVTPTLMHSPPVIGGRYQHHQYNGANYADGVVVGTPPTGRTASRAGGGVGGGYLDVMYGSPVGSGSPMHRATTPQRAMMSAIAAAERRLAFGGFPFCPIVFFAPLCVCVCSH